MNSIGRVFRVSIFGESHGAAVGVTIDGCLAGLAVTADDFVVDMNRRRGGSQTGTTSRIEADEPEFISGVFNGFTTGTPLTMLFKNSNTKSEDYTSFKEIPRPGHADFVAEKKHKGFQDHRGGGHFSGRLTVALVAAGVIAKKVVQKLHPGIRCSAIIREMGGEVDLEKSISDAKINNDSIGGIVECITENIPIGIGEPFFDSVESQLSHFIFSIPAVKGIEFGSGFSAAKMKGSEHNDALVNTSGETATNHSGGITGGLTNGNPLIFRVAIKPTSSTPHVQNSLNVKTGQMEDFTVQGRHDLAIVLRVPVVVEAVTYCALADLLQLST